MKEAKSWLSFYREENQSTGRIYVEKGIGSSEEQKRKSERSIVLLSSSPCFRQFVLCTNFCCFKSVLPKIQHPWKKYLKEGKTVFKTERKGPKLCKPYSHLLECKRLFFYSCSMLQIYT